MGDGDGYKAVGDNGDPVEYIRLVVRDPGDPGSVFGDPWFCKSVVFDDPWFCKRVVFGDCNIVVFGDPGEYRGETGGIFLSDFEITVSR